MHILIDQRLPEPAKEKLASFGELILLEPGKAAYPAIAAHPDIFCCQTDDLLVVAPNLSAQVKVKLDSSGVSYTEGHRPVGKTYPETARYNAVVTGRFLIGNTNYTDRTILEKAHGKTIIRVNQGYTRCNLIPLPNNRFITSDRGIEKTLAEHGLEVLFVNPNGIRLPGFKNGFIGGTCGVWQDKLFFTGRLYHFPEGHNIRNFVPDMEIIELYDGPLFDGGSLIFI